MARVRCGRAVVAGGGMGVEVEGFRNTGGSEIAEKEKRGFSTARANTFAGSEREKKRLGLLRSK